MPASEEWRCYTIHAGEVSPVAAQVGEAFKNGSAKLRHIRRVDAEGLIEQASPDDAFKLEIKKDTSLATVPDGSGIRKMQLTTGNQAGVAGDTGNAHNGKSWVFPRGAVTLEEDEAFNAIVIPVNTNGGEKYAVDVTFWFHH